jgi:hypothetical protein
MSASALTVLHGVLLAAFVGVASVSMLTAVLSLLRVQHVALAWRPRRAWWDVPRAPSLFLAAVACGFAAAAATGTPLRPSVLLGYPAGGAFWWLAAWLARTVVASPYGLVPDVQRLDRAVPWRSVTDYAAFPPADAPADVPAEHGAEDAAAPRRYVFFYDAPDGTRARLDWPVPARHADAFAALVTAKLDARFDARPADLVADEWERGA